MIKNVSKTDKVFRLLISVMLVYMCSAGTLTGAWGIAALAVAIVLVATSILGTCPLYTLFGISTCPVKKDA